ncbi:Sugar isomerase (SIS) [Penicillium chermesinum]|uniref:Sugar isomerase (SIS) n=1 Tax=Penicillium chermesinum TaxID=63820 RepID=A0A9W9NU94_9EURO|nr:Sugar isomerase (SIS) [Penicillium chermesinum]KAJ5226123.1 Sugar isomerase (SIS) [Penicillium chermesinum]
MTSKLTPMISRWPPTPDGSDAPPSMARKDESAIDAAVHVISTERAALSHLEHLYQTDAQAQYGLSRAVDQIARSVRDGGKLVVCGVGKSGKIGRKIEATMTSLGIYSAFLHPTEALHGDLGTLARTLLPPSTYSLSIPVIAMTSHLQPSDCPLLSSHEPAGNGILLPAPVHEDEESSLGVKAPTSSTAVALCLGDALAIAIARNLHTEPGRGPAEVFRGYHPGGAIGAAALQTRTPSTTPPSSIFNTFDSPSSFVSLKWDDIAGGAPIPPFTLQQPPSTQRIPLDTMVSLDSIPTVSAQSVDQVTLLDILMTAIQHPNAKSWVFLSSTVLIPQEGFGRFFLKIQMSI